MRYIALLLLVSSAFAQKKPITLETLNEAGRGGGRGFGGAPVWAPDGKTFAFREGRTLKIYDPATKTSKELVSTEPMDSAAMTPPSDDGPMDWQNRRARTGALQWSEDGKLLLYPSAGDTFVVHADSGKWEQVTKTPVAEIDPTLSPDGKSVLFRRGWDIYTADLATHKETRLTTNGTATLRNGGTDWVYPEELYLSTAFWWSPDSKSVSYLQFDMSGEPIIPHADLLKVRAVYEPERYPQAGEHNANVHLGVVAASGGPTKWFDVGDTRDSYLVGRVGWMPNSRALFVVRTNRVQNRLELLSIDVESRTVTPLLGGSDPYWINLGEAPQFLHDGKRFLWTTEHDGYRHIYIFSNDGKAASQVTEGPWEVSAINGVDEAADRVFYSSTEPSSLERHLYSIRLNGSDKRALSPEPGTHMISMGPTGAYYLDTFSSLTSPPRTTLHSGDGKELGVYREADRTQIDQYEILPTEIVNFKAADGTTNLYGRLIKPAGFQAGKKYPVIVTVYGGPGVGLPVHNSWQGINIDQVLAHKGYVIWQCENRGGTGRGHAFETAIYHKLGVAELADQVAGVKHLLSLGFADPQRIGIHGWSYGGFMTINAMLNAPDVFRAGFAGAPVTNWVNYDTIYTERYMGLPSENPDGYRDTALPPKAKNLQGRLMLVHNFEDDNVLFQNSLQMTNALQLAGKQFEYMLYPQKSHGVGGSAARQMNQMMIEFFDRSLK